MAAFLGGIRGKNEAWIWSKYFVHLEILKELKYILRDTL